MNYDLPCSVWVTHKTLPGANTTDGSFYVYIYLSPSDLWCLFVSHSAEKFPLKPTAQLCVGVLQATLHVWTRSSELCGHLFHLIIPHFADTMHPVCPTYFWHASQPLYHHYIIITLPESPLLPMYLLVLPLPVWRSRLNAPFRLTLISRVAWH